MKFKAMIKRYRTQAVHHRSRKRLHRPLCSAATLFSQITVTSNHASLSELSSTLSTQRNTAISPDARNTSSYRSIVWHAHCV